VAVKSNHSRLFQKILVIILILEDEVHLGLQSRVATVGHCWWNLYWIRHEVQCSPQLFPFELGRRLQGYGPCNVLFLPRKSQICAIHGRYSNFLVKGNPAVRLCIIQEKICGSFLISARKRTVESFLVSRFLIYC